MTMPRPKTVFSNQQQEVHTMELERYYSTYKPSTTYVPRTTMQIKKLELSIRR